MLCASYPDVARAHKSVCAHTAIFHTGRFCNLCLEIETGQNMQASRVVELISDIRGYDDVQNESVRSSISSWWLGELS